jgi:GDP/UDP-N,N'-diacetylbacillosamine 2-epimerase (hydrolysing)
MRELLSALAELEDTSLIFTMPNADTGGRELGTLVLQFVEKHPRAKVYTSLGQLRYFSCLAQVDGMVGNSSSGLLEAPAFNIGTINIGDRQKGRLKSQSVIDCAPSSESIIAALKTLYSADFQANLATAQNPYGNGGASESIVKKLAEYPLENIRKKQFYNLSVNDLA